MYVKLFMLYILMVKWEEWPFALFQINYYMRVF